MSGSDKVMKLSLWHGKEDEWRMWSKKFMGRASHMEYLSIMSGDVKLPTDAEYSAASDEKKKEYDAIKKKNKLGYYELCSCMDDLKSFNLVDEHDGDLFEAWKALKEEFEPTTGEVLVTLLEDYHTMRLENARLDITKYISEMENKRQKLAILGHKINDQSFMVQILATLPKEYILLTSHLTREVSQGTLGLADLRAELKSVYLRLKKANNWKDDENALFAKGKFKKRFKGNCLTCGKQGHKSAECWEKEENKSKRPKNWKKKSPDSEDNGPGDKKSKFSGTCWNCGEQGHRSSNCPKKERANKAEEDLAETSEEEEGAMIATVVEETLSDKIYLTLDKFENGVWIADTGASSHMTN